LEAILANRLAGAFLLRSRPLFFVEITLDKLHDARPL
jgi:hypothetical protein